MVVIWIFQLLYLLNGEKARVGLHGLQIPSF